MKIRCDVHLGDHVSKIVLVPKQEEKLEHLALKLAAYVMFWSKEPIVEPSSDHPSLMGIDIRPDVMALNVSGELNLWVECGFVTLNKLNKMTRRFPHARIVVLKATEREAERLRKSLVEEIRHHARVEIWTWKDPEFKDWVNALGEKTEIFGDAHEKSFNLVVNETAYSADLVSV